MGKKLDALLGRSFKISKFKTLARLAISRLAILKNHRQVRYSLAKSDVIQLLKLGQHEQALLRVDHVIRDQNMMDAFVLIEEYCQLLVERVVLLQKNKECPDELKEAISSLIFASSRCGEFPELYEIRGVFVSRFGKEVAARAIELHNNCGVHPKIVQKLSAQRPSLESRLKVLKDIADENGIILQLEEYCTVLAEDILDISNKQKQEESNKSTKLDNIEPQYESYVVPEESSHDKMSESLKARKKYRDVAAAAQEAFESAAYAAAAARAAVELSRSESQNNDQDDDRGSNHPQGTMHDSDGSLTPKPLSGGHKINSIYNISSESEAEDMAEDNGRVHLKELEGSKKKTGMDRTPSTSSSDSNLSDCLPRTGSVGNQMVSYGSDKEVEMEQVSTPSPMHPDLDSYREPSLPAKEHLHQHIRQAKAIQEEDGTDEFGTDLPYKSPKWVPQKSYANTTVNPMEEKSKLKNTHSANSVEQFHLQIDRPHLSMRTRRARWD